MICENCKNEYNVVYGSGRFCCVKCARGFSTKIKRIEINAKVSEKLKGRNVDSACGFLKGDDPRRKLNFLDPEVAKKASRTRHENFRIKESLTPFELKSKSFKKRVVITEQNNKCNLCGNDSWLGSPLVLELHHIDGNHENNLRDNFVALCPSIGL